MVPQMISTRTRIVPVAAAFLLAAGLAGCSDTRKALGIDKSLPNEYTVMSRAPLTMPPDFRLRPPQPGAERPQETRAEEVAKQTVFRAVEPKPSMASLADTNGRSAGEMALLEQAGAIGADPKIRETVAREATQLVEADRSFIDRLVFWQKPEEPGVVIDATKEAQRLRENAALGKQPTVGDTPTIQRRKKGILEGIFN
jgi:hypothetical protein